MSSPRPLPPPQLRALRGTGRQARARARVLGLAPIPPEPEGCPCASVRPAVGELEPEWRLVRTPIAPHPAGRPGAERGRRGSAWGKRERARSRRPCPAGAGARGGRSGEAGGEGAGDGGRGGGGRLQRPRTPRASHTRPGRLRAARRRPAPRSLLPPPRGSVAPALPARLRRRARGRAHDRRPREASARASRAGYVDCPAKAGPRDQPGPARGPGGQRGL